MEAAKFEPAPAAPEGIAVREDERRRLARELHDGPAQSLAAALFGVDLALAAVDRQPVAAREELIAARELVRDALADVRDLMTGLRPRLLEERGLAAALHGLAGTPLLWGPQVTVETRGIALGERLPPDLELGFFRIAQEAVSNSRRHSAASNVQVSLLREAASASLLVTDDGRGFSPRFVARTFGRGEGLPGMRERALLLGGALSIESAPGSGTRIAVSAPVPDRRKGTGAAEVEGEP